MIELTRDVLADLGLIEPGARPRFNVALTRGATLGADVFLADGTFVHVKASELEPLESEYRSAQDAWQRFGPYTAQPLAFARRDGWDLLVTQGISSAPLVSSHLRRRSFVPQALAGYFRRSATLARPAAHGQAHSQLLGSLSLDPATAPRAKGLAARLGTETLAALAELPLLPQHGDFTRNNVGVTDDGVIVFDWEDFGVVQLPGLDLCTLVLSLADFEPAALQASLGRQPAASGRYVSFVNEGCRALGLDATLFRRLVPLYLLVFLKLKATYSEQLRLALTRLLDELVPEPAIRVA